LPDCFSQLRRLLEARLSKHASREYIQVLRLKEMNGDSYRLKQSRRKRNPPADH